MKGKSVALTSFSCSSSSAQDMPLDLTPTAGTPNMTGGIPITPILTPNTWASIEQVFKDLTSTPHVDTPSGDEVLVSRSLSSTLVPTVVEALHDEAHSAENLSMKREFAIPATDQAFLIQQSQLPLVVAPKKLKAEKPAIVAATTTTTDALVFGNSSQSQRRKAANDDGHEVSKVMLRRERNRMAAARCRQRRVDLTQSLLQECRALKAEKAELQEQLQRVQQQKEHLEFILQAHEALCKVKLMAPETINSAPLANCIVVKNDPASDDLQQQQLLQTVNTTCSAKRPSSLLLAPQSETLPLKKKRV